MRTLHTAIPATTGLKRGARPPPPAPKLHALVTRGTARTRTRTRYALHLGPRAWGKSVRHLGQQSRPHCNRAKARHGTGDADRLGSNDHTLLHVSVRGPYAASFQGPKALGKAGRTSGIGMQLPSISGKWVTSEATPASMPYPRCASRIRITK